MKETKEQFVLSLVESYFKVTDDKTFTNKDVLDRIKDAEGTYNYLEYKDSVTNASNVKELLDWLEEQAQSSIRESNNAMRVNDFEESRVYQTRSLAFYSVINKVKQLFSDEAHIEEEVSGKVVKVYNKFATYQERRDDLQAKVIDTVVPSKVDKTKLLGVKF